MCGIVGWVDPGGGVDATVLERMRETIAHRGPDGAGLSVSPDRTVGLAHRRLSIIDLSDEAGQPMEDAGGDLEIVYNGEIYNHRALRRQLEEEGARFRTDHSDTEVLLQGYRHWGMERLLGALIGMFAFGLHDRREGCLWLVRDRLGVKPLYVARLGRALLFASEAKALFAHPRVKPRLDRESYVHYLSFRAVPAPRTLFAGVEKLAAGELMRVDLRSGDARRREWWNPLDAAHPAPATHERAVDELEALMESSVSHRLESDVPVGLFLSGGVDSGYLLALAAQHRSGLDAFTVRYPGHDDYNEDASARELAERFRARYHDVPLTGEEFAAELGAVVYHQDEPIAAPVCASVYALSRAAREAGVPVILAGEGGDELFVGYRNWLRFRDLMRWDRRLPDLPGRTLRRAAHAALRTAQSPLATHPEVLRRAVRGQPLFWSGAMDFGEEAKRALLGPGWSGALPDTYEAVIRPEWERYVAARGARDATGWMSYADMRFRLPELMLPRLDKMGMAFSIEGRVPLLDHRVAEFRMSLPPDWCQERGREGKRILKEAASRRLSRDFVYRRKRGFQAPVKEWRDAEFRQHLLPALGQFAERTGLMDPAALRRLLARRGDRLFFSLTNFMFWYQIYVEDVVGDCLPAVPHQPWSRT